MAASIQPRNYAGRASFRAFENRLMSKQSQRKTLEETEFGDFQTPPDLAAEVCDLLCRLGLNPGSIVEPTCGEGSLLFQALDHFPDAHQAIAHDVSPLYIATVRARLQRRVYANRVSILQGNFFQTDWPQLIDKLPEPILVVGNPPWITSAQIGALGGANLPEKTNFQKHKGLNAKTGKSNFDISEWMLIRILHWLDNRTGTLAMLCKTAVARKLLFHAWKGDLSLSDAALYHINAAKHFGATVDACLFVCNFAPNAYNHDCSVFDTLTSPVPKRIIGYRDHELVSKVNLYEQWKHLKGNELYKWRSGIKHDCSKVMELTKEGSKYRNGLGQLVELEDNYLYPMLKTSEVAKPDAIPTRYMLVPQTFVGEDTSTIKSLAPLTWQYLEDHGNLLDKRGSSIYKERPRFSVFGVGDYSFAPWKVAISGFYKRLGFKIVGPVEGKPVMLDDSSYSIPCRSAAEAALIASLFNSQPASEFFEAYIFWDAKRPITSDLLRRLDLSQVARELRLGADLQQFLLPAPIKIRRKRLAVPRQEALQL